MPNTQDSLLLRFDPALSNSVKLSAKVSSGFTLVELLVSIAVIAIILTITIVAINPPRQFEKSRDTKRKSDVETLANAIQQYVADNRGVFPADIQTSPLNISSSQIDLCGNLIPNYLPALPQDPISNNGAKILSSQCSNYDTHYTVRFGTTAHVIVEAPNAEGDEAIASIR